MTEKLRIGFLGSGGIAQSHVYALDSLKYYYPDAPSIYRVVVASPTPKNRLAFAERFGFDHAIPPDEVFLRDDIDALYILGTNKTHTPQLLRAVVNPVIQRIYVEKPLGTSFGDIQSLEKLNSSSHGKFIMMGFQYLQKSALRKALTHWHTGVFGEPIHFRADYLHSSYLDPNYRQSHPERFEPMPINGALVDLGSHILSLLVAFLGNKLIVRSAATSGHFEDVPTPSDLCTTVLLEEPETGAAGVLLASRVSAGTGDLLSLELRGENGALLYNTNKPDCYEYYLEGEGWRRVETMNDYRPVTKFPSDYVPSGWLRALIHNHYLFLGGDPGMDFIPDLAHGIQVQKLVQAVADQVIDNSN